MSDPRGRGKKTNYNKNWVSAKEWSEAKKLGRKKQRFIAEPSMESVLGGFKGGYWEKL